MKRSIVFHAFLILTLLAVAASGAPAFASSVQGSFQKTYTVNGMVDLEAMTHSGDITIRSGPAGTVTISGKIHVEDRWLTGDRHGAVTDIEQNPPIRQSGNSIRIDYVNVHGISVDYEVTMPADSTVRTDTGSGDQRVEDMRGSLNLESGSGDMRLQNTGAVRVHTGSGNVEARDISGTITAEAGSGDIRVEGNNLSDVRVNTGSGNIELRGVKGTLQAESGSGDVTIDGEQTGAWEIRTSSGNVELRLPANAAFDLEASAGSGEIETSRQVVAMVQGRVGGSRSKITGKANGGGAELKIHTSSGDIRIN